MQILKWSFNPALIPSLASLLLFLFLLALGFWQLDRADQKQAISDDYNFKTALEPINLNNASGAALTLNTLFWRRCTINGRYDGSQVFLLDNQIVNGVAGYYVYSRFIVSDTNINLLINRGWVAMGDYRNHVPRFEPVDSGPVTITGQIAAYPPLPGIIRDKVLSGQEVLAPGIFRIQQITEDGMEQILGTDLLSVIVRLDAGETHGFWREWTPPVSGRELHLGYAYQWFAMAAVFVLVFLSIYLQPPELP
jgi:surfeit locus 1 family protein